MLFSIIYTTSFGFNEPSSGDSVLVNVVVVPMPTHCTITRFGFRARRIHGVECGLFSNYAPLGQATLRVGRVSV